jgi:hypothetical protein
VSFTGAGGDLAALVTVHDGTNYKGKIENGIDEYLNSRILFVCTRKYARTVLCGLFKEKSPNKMENITDQMSSITVLIWKWDSKVIKKDGTHDVKGSEVPCLGMQ